jgi:hypothetical protein
MLPSNRAPTEIRLMPQQDPTLAPRSQMRLGNNTRVSARMDPPSSSWPLAAPNYQSSAFEASGLEPMDILDNRVEQAPIGD